VNIDYTIVWALNRDEGRFNVHDGDLTSMVVLYDPTIDRVVRLTYSMHGCLLAAYQFVSGQKVTMTFIDGKNINLASTSELVTKVDIGDAQEGDDHSGSLCSGWYSPEQHVFFSSDPKSHLFEHPAVFAENGTHELWPNASGFVSLGGGHAGDSVSYLPQRVEVLGSFAEPTKVDAPFVHYNGTFGSDPASLVLHRTWCWPDTCDQNNANIPDTEAHTRFSDMNPYREHLGHLVWPPTVDESPKNVFVAAADTKEGTGSINSPFLGLNAALSFTPAGSTLNLRSGHYVWSGPLRLCRAITLKAQDGPVTINVH
jgi:hypothetical protein